MIKIEKLSFEAPIRICPQMNRKFQTPVMNVCDLLKLWDALRLLFYAKFREDPQVGVQNAGHAFTVVKDTLERYMAGDHSMIEAIQTDVTGCQVSAAASKKRKRTSPDTDDVLLELPGGLTVLGMRAPSAPVHLFWDSDVSGEVFSVYSFIDAIVREGSSVSTYADISRVIWKRLSVDAPNGSDWGNMTAKEFKHMSMQAVMRQSLQLNRRSPTPAMGMKGLFKLFQQINSDFQTGAAHPRGRKLFCRQLDRRMCSGLYEMFKKCHDGDRSMIRSATQES
jgi:hypothetical protein